MAVVVVRREHQHQRHKNIYSTTAPNFTTTNIFSNQLFNNSTFQMGLDPRQACWLWGNLLERVGQVLGEDT